jgi:DNA-binding CsgD family transcriptional regulator
MAKLTFPQMLHFTDKCRGALSPQDITRPLGDLLDTQGIKSWFVGSLGAINEWKGFSYDHVPELWRQRYIDQRYYEDDDIFHHVAVGGAKTKWSTVRCLSDKDRFKRGAIVANEAAECGLSDGLIMPIQEFGDLPGAVSYGGHDLDLSEDAQASLFLVGTFAYESLRRLSVRTTPVPPCLTEREMQVLRWTAQGKSAAAIAVLLCISVHTVREHQTNIREKYGVSTNIQAVVYAAIDGRLKHSFEH